MNSLTKPDRDLFARGCDVFRMSDKEQRIYQEIAIFQDRTGYSPSFRDLARACGYASTNTVKHHLEKMRAKGFIMYDDRTARSLVLLGEDVPV